MILNQLNVNATGTHGDMTVRSSTVANNIGEAATPFAGKNILVATATGVLSLQNTIVADSATPNPMVTGVNCQNSGGVITSLGSNLADDASCNLGAAGDKPSTDPGLATLALNSGQTPTHAIAKTSAATDAGSPGALTGFDQRGLTRPVDFSDVANAAGSDGTDIGAFEVQVPAPAAGTGPTPKQTKCKKKKKKKKK